MSSKFISSTTIDQSLQNGTAFLNIKNIKVQNLQPNFPVKADGDKNIYSTKLEIADVNNLQTALNNVISNPYVGTLQSDNFKGDSIKDKTETSTINLTNTEIDLVATSVKINGQPVDNSITLQDAYNNSVIAETQLVTTKPYIIKSVDTAEIVNIDGDTKEVKFTGDVLVNGVNVEDQILNIGQEIVNLQNTKYDKTGGILTGDLIHNGNNVQLQGSGAIQIQNQGTVQIQPTGALTMKGHGVLGQINMSNNKITNLATPTDPFDASTKLYVDNSISGIPPTDLTDLNTKTQNISLTKTNATQTFMNQNLVLGTEGGQIISGIDGQGLDVPITNVSPLLVGDNGYVFEVKNNVVLTRLKIKEELFNTSSQSNVFISFWIYQISINRWILRNSSSLTFGSVGNENGYRWTENGPPYALSVGTRYGITFNMDLGQELSNSPLTIGDDITITGSVYRNVGQPNTFPENETTDGNAPVGSFDYVSSDQFDKSLNCGPINCLVVNTPTVNTNNIDGDNLTINSDNMTIESNFLVVDASINTTDFAKYQGGVDYLNPVDLNSLAAVGYVNQEIANIPPTDLSELENKTQNIVLTETDNSKTVFANDVYKKEAVTNLGQYLTTTGVIISGNVNTPFDGTVNSLLLQQPSPTVQTITFDVEGLSIQFPDFTGDILLLGQPQQRAVYTVKATGQSFTRQFNDDVQPGSDINECPIAFNFSEISALRIESNIAINGNFQCRLTNVKVGGIELVDGLEVNRKLSTEKYVDDKVNPLELKTQNIQLTTSTGQTDLLGDFSVVGNVIAQNMVGLPLCFAGNYTGDGNVNYAIFNGLSNQGGNGTITTRNIGVSPMSGTADRVSYVKGNSTASTSFAARFQNPGSQFIFVRRFTITGESGTVNLDSNYDVEPGCRITIQKDISDAPGNTSLILYIAPKLNTQVFNLLSYVSESINNSDLNMDETEPFTHLQSNTIENNKQRLDSLTNSN